VMNDPPFPFVMIAPEPPECVGIVVVIPGVDPAPVRNELPAAPGVPPVGPVLAEHAITRHDAKAMKTNAAQFLAVTMLLLSLRVRNLPSTVVTRSGQTDCKGRPDLAQDNFRIYARDPAVVRRTANVHLVRSRSSERVAQGHAGSAKIP
jgi:hypothetical protein